MHGMTVNFERRNEVRVIFVKSERVPIVPPTHERTKPETS
jgi:hypothetical protein